MLSPRGKKELKINQRRILINSIEIGIPAPEQVFILGQRHTSNGKIVGRVRNSKTLNYKSFTPHRDGLFCERIFGPVQSYICACGKQGPLTTSKGTLKFCPRCEVEYTDQRARRYRVGYIGLVSPVTHIWHLKGRPSYLSLFLGKRKKTLATLAYCNDYLVEQAFSKVAGNDALSSAKQHRGELWRSEITGTDRAVTFGKRERQLALPAVALSLRKSERTFGRFRLHSLTHRVSEEGATSSGATFFTNRILKGLKESLSLKGLTIKRHPTRDAVQSKTIKGFTISREQEKSKVWSAEADFIDGPLDESACLSERSSDKQARSGATFQGRKVEPFDKQNRKCTSFLKSLRQLAALQNRARTAPQRSLRERLGGSNSPKRSTRVLPSSSAHIKLEVSEPPFGVVGTRFRQQRDTLSYTRSHTLPFLPTFICEFHLRDGLLSFFDTFPPSEDIPIPVYCKVPRRYPLRDVHKFMADQAFSKVQFSAPSVTRAEPAKLSAYRPSLESYDPPSGEGEFGNRSVVPAKSSIKGFDSQNTLVEDQSQLRSSPSPQAELLLNPIRLEPEVRDVLSFTEQANDNNWQTKNKSSLSTANLNSKGRVIADSGQLCLRKREVGLINRKDIFHPSIGMINEKKLLSPFVTRAPRTFASNFRVLSFAEQAKVWPVGRKLEFANLRGAPLREVSQHSSVTVLREVLLSLLLGRVVTTLIGFTPSLAACLNRPESTIAKSKVLVGGKPTVVMARGVGSQIIVAERPSGNFRATDRLAKIRRTRTGQTFASRKLRCGSQTLAKLEVELRLALRRRAPTRLLPKRVPTRYFATQSKKVSTKISEAILRPAEKKPERNRPDFRFAKVTARSLTLLGNERELSHTFGLQPKASKRSRVSTKSKSFYSKPKIGSKNFQLKHANDSWLPVIGESPARLPIRLVFADGWSNVGSLSQAWLANPYRSSRREFDRAVTFASRKYGQLRSTWRLAADAGTAGQDRNAHLFDNRKDVRAIATEADNLGDKLGEPGNPRLEKSSNHRYFEAAKRPRASLEDSFFSLRSWVRQRRTLNPLWGQPEPARLSRGESYAVVRSGKLSPYWPARENYSLLGFSESVEDWLEYWFNRWLQKRYGVKCVLSETEQVHLFDNWKYVTATRAGQTFAKRTLRRGSCSAKQSTRVVTQTLLSKVKSYDRSEVLSKAQDLKGLSLLSKAEQRPTVFDRFIGAMRPCLALSSPSQSRPNVRRTRATARVAGRLANVTVRSANQNVIAGRPSGTFAKRKFTPQNQIGEQVLFKQSNPVLPSIGQTQASRTFGLPAVEFSLRESEQKLELHLCTIKGPLLLLALRSYALGLIGRPGDNTSFFSHSQFTNSACRRSCLDSEGPNTGSTSLEIQLLLPECDSDQNTFSLERFTSKLAVNDARSKVYKEQTLQRKVTKSNEVASRPRAYLEDKIRSVGPKHNIACYLFKHDQRVNWIKSGVLSFTRKQDTEINCPGLSTEPAGSETDLLPIIPVALLNSFVVDRGRGYYLAKIGETTFQLPCSPLGDTQKVSYSSPEGEKTLASRTLAKLELELPFLDPSSSSKNSAHFPFEKLPERSSGYPSGVKPSSEPHSVRILAKRKLVLQATKNKNQRTSLLNLDSQVWLPKIVTIFKIIRPKKELMVACSASLSKQLNAGTQFRLGVLNRRLTKKGPKESQKQSRTNKKLIFTGSRNAKDYITGPTMSSESGSQTFQSVEEANSKGNLNLNFRLLSEAEHAKGSTLSERPSGNFMPTGQTFACSAKLSTRKLLAKVRRTLTFGLPAKLSLCESYTSLTSPRFVVPGSSWARRALERYRDTDLGASLTRVQQLTKSAPANRDVVLGAEGTIATTFQRSSFAQALLELPNQTQDGKMKPELSVSNEDEYVDEEDPVLAPFGQLNKEQLKRAANFNSSEARVRESQVTATQAKFEFTGKVSTDSYMKAQLDLQAIQEVLSYTGGGALRELLRCFDTQAFSVILLNEIKLLREYHKGYFLYEYDQISRKARTQAKLELAPLVHSEAEHANSNSSYANSSFTSVRVAPLKAERDFVKTTNSSEARVAPRRGVRSSKAKEIEIDNKPPFGSNLNFRGTRAVAHFRSAKLSERSSGYPFGVRVAGRLAKGSDAKVAEYNNNYEELPEEINRFSRAIHRNARRLKIVQLLMRNKRRPEWMLISALPVLPPDLRPILQMSENLIVASDLNTLYQRVIYRNNRQYKLRIVEWSYATSLQRLVQDAVDRLIENGKGGSKPFLTPGGRPLKSLSDTLKGKKGRFRLNLLGKRVDFSGRSVIVVSPHLKIHECGLPREMALELYQYLLIRQMLLKRQVSSVILAKRVIRQQKAFVWDTLRELIYHHPLLLNRAPTLHRLGIQAFQPKLVLGSTILLHPLVCAGFNADFDGDQMGVHLPLCDEARAEAWDLLWSRNNLLSPATGEPILLPSQDMVLGFYHMTALLPSRYANSTTQTAGSTHFRRAQVSAILRSPEKTGQTFGLSSVSRELRRSYGFVPIADRSVELSTPTKVRAPLLLVPPAPRSRAKVKEEKGLRKSYFFSPLDVVRAYQNGDLDIHTPIWLQWKGKIENNDSDQTPLELRINSFGVSTQLYPSYKYRKDASYKSIETFNLFIRTTPGRVVVNNMFLDCSD